MALRRRRFGRIRLLALLLAFLGPVSAFVCANARGDDRDAIIDDLQGQLRAQGQRLGQLERRVSEQQDVLRRLPSVTDDDGSLHQSSREIEARVERLEESVLGFEQESSRFTEFLSTYARRSVKGRIHIDAWQFPKDSPGINVMEHGDPVLDPLDRLVYRRIRIGLFGDVPPENMSYRVEIEFSGEDGSQFRDAWIGWDDLWLLHTVRLGNLKRPYGLDHLNSSNLNVFMERPFVVDAFNEDNRRFGLASSGVSDDLRFNWKYGVYNLALIQDAGSTLADAPQLELAWRLANTLWYDESSGGRCYGHWALSGTFAFPDGFAPNDGVVDNQARFRTRPEGRSGNHWLNTDRIDGAESYQILGVESVANLGAFQFVGEYMNLWLQRADGFGSDIHLHGGYFYLSYFLTGEHIPWNRTLGTIGRVEPFEDFFGDRGFLSGRRGPGAWQIAVRLSYANFNDDNVFGGIGQSVTFGLNWHWNARARLQLNYISGRVDDRLADLAGGGTAMVSGSYQITGARCIIDF